MHQNSSKHAAYGLIPPPYLHIWGAWRVPQRGQPFSGSLSASQCTRPENGWPVWNPTLGAPAGCLCCRSSAHGARSCVAGCKQRSDVISFVMGTSKGTLTNKLTLPALRPPPRGARPQPALPRWHAFRTRTRRSIPGTAPCNRQEKARPHFSWRALRSAKRREKRGRAYARVWRRATWRRGCSHRGRRPGAT